jgi:RNA polymerase sigma factor (sigma-70 family)
VDASDHRLWQLVKADDANAFTELFERYANDVYNFCFRRTGSWSRAEDLVAAVFLEAWRKRTELDLTSSDHRLRPWLIGVAHNKIRNESRGLRRLAVTVRRLTEREVPDFADDAVERLADEQRMAHLNQAVSGLPKEELDCLLLYAWGELAYEEIADVLGVPIGTVRSRLARARGRLRELDPHSEHERDDETSMSQEATR